MSNPCLVWSSAFRRLDRLGPAEAGTPSLQRFHGPMHEIRVVDAFREPHDALLANEQVTHPRFMASTHDGILEVYPFHEPQLVWSPAFRRLDALRPAEDGTPN